MFSHLVQSLRLTCRYLLGALALCLLGACDNASPPPKLKQVLQTGVLKVGTVYGPTTYYTGPGGPEGFEYELAKGFAEHLGVQLEVLPFFSLNEAFSHLHNQHLDLIAAGLTVTPERAAQYRFGPAYQRVSQKLVYKQGQPRPRDLQSLDGNLMVVADSSHADTLRELQPHYAQLRWQETRDMDMEELMEAVVAEQYDYTVADSNILAVMRRRYPELAVGFTLHEEQRVAWAMSANTDDSLLGAMLDYFGSLHDSGQLAALEDRYFGHVRQFNYVATRLFIKAVDEVLPQFRPWFEQYAGDLDWRLLAAMAYQESLWDPLAKSPTGVRGLMMLTLDTAQDLGITSRLDPQQSISGGARYLRDLIRRIPDRIDYPDRIYFALAAYNIGLGHLEDARVLTQRQGGNPDLWVDVKQRLPLLRQKKYYRTTKYGYARGDEAATYVANIRRYYDTLVWLDEQRSKTGSGSLPQDAPTDSADEETAAK